MQSLTYIMGIGDGKNLDCGQRDISRLVLSQFTIVILLPYNNFEKQKTENIVVIYLHIHQQI